MSRTSTLRWLLVGACAFAVGCPLFFDLSGVGLDDDLVLDPDVGAEAKPDVQADLPPAVELPRGKTCAGPGSIEGTCDPVVQDCRPSQVCDFQFVTQDPPTFSTGCLPASGSNDIAQGDPCRTDSTEQTCQLGLICRIDRCFRLCRRADAAGCQSDEFCSPFSAAIGQYGICAAECQMQ